MPDETFQINLLRLISAEVYVLCGMVAAREMYGKGYFSLGLGEKGAVDQTVQALVAANYQAATPELLKAQTTQQAVGFQTPSEKERS